jgi:ribosomal RNA-processing protein 9
VRKKPKNLKFIKGLQKVPGSRDRQGHTGNILTVAVSPSGKYVATGGADRKLIIWDAETLTPMKTFTYHRDAVSGLSFARHISANSSGEQLFSGSFDRTIKTWALSGAGHAYVETLFGHQDNVTSVASMMTDQCVSVGARDRTARLWKVVDETQLVFRGDSSKKEEYQTNGLDCVATIPPAHFVTGSDSGALSLWSIYKKKPLYTIPLAHGLDPLPPSDELSAEADPETAAHNCRFLRRMPRWITALTTVPGTDIVLSGSWDGWIRAWRVSEDKKMIYPLGPVGGASSISPSTPSLQLKQTLTFDGVVSSDAMVIDHSEEQTRQESEPLLKGVVNDIVAFERRRESSKLGSQPLQTSKSKNGTTSSEPEPRGICILAALGKEHRLGRWKCFENNNYGGSTSQGRNGAVVFEVSFSDPAKAEDTPDDV